jgi:predicted TIM-barrel fold metal-dependent hydrolase
VANQLISCDDHMDLGQLPEDLWTTRLPPGLRDRAPRIAERDGHLLWASDYPHPDSVWPNLRAAIERQMAGLSAEMRRKLTYDNAPKLYGLN